MKKYQNNPNWTMFKEEDKLFIAKGADEIYYLDDVNDVDIVLKAYNKQEYSNLEPDLIKKLELSGVIYEEKFSKNSSKIKIAFKYVGNSFNKLTLAFKNLAIIDKRIIITNENDCDLLLIVRTNGMLKDILKGYNKIKIPHLFIDIAYDHTISLGPIVFKNETACLGCLAAKLIQNWGDLTPPSKPQVIDNLTLIQALILQRIQEFITLGNCPELVNGVWNYNLHTFETKLDTIYKNPWCPLCSNKTENPKLDLPWMKEDNNEK